MLVANGFEMFDFLVPADGNVCCSELNEDDESL